MLNAVFTSRQYERCTSFNGKQTKKINLLILRKQRQYLELQQLNFMNLHSRNENVTPSAASNDKCSRFFFSLDDISVRTLKSLFMVQLAWS